jgi:hypothetical protein
MRKTIIPCMMTKFFNRITKVIKTRESELLLHNVSMEDMRIILWYVYGTFRKKVKSSYESLRGCS